MANYCSMYKKHIRDIQLPSKDDDKQYFSRLTVNITINQVIDFFLN